MKTLLIRNILGMTLVGAVSQYALASDNSSLSSLIDDGAFAKKRRMAALINNQEISDKAPAAVLTPTPTATRESISEDIRLGVVSDVKVAKGLTQAFKKDANATGTAAQGNISGSTIDGGGVVVASSVASVPVIVVERPVSAPRLAIPECARGYEAIYERFLRGKLIYRPIAGSDVGKRELAISDFLSRGQNPLESTFDLSGCGDAGKYLSISTGYRRAVRPENSDKWEVFITPKFLIEVQKASTATHYAAIANASWTATYAVIQNYGGWTDLNDYCYNTTITDSEINSQNLYVEAPEPYTAHLAFLPRPARFYLQF